MLEVMSVCVGECEGVWVRVCECVCVYPLGSGEYVLLGLSILGTSSHTPHSMGQHSESIGSVT